MATATLVWLGHQATRTSQQSLRLLVERRAVEHLALLSAVLAQDMKGAHATVLVPVTPAQLVLQPPYDLADAFARGFARFPYPESFFVWKNSDRDGGLTYVFNRADRLPPWRGSQRLGGPYPYPVEVIRDPAALQGVVAEAQQQARFGYPFAAFETKVEQTPYQVVINLLYDADDSASLFGVVGFLVNLNWVREAYFDELLLQTSRIGGEPGVSLTILDDGNQTIASSRRHLSGALLLDRPFPLLFADRALTGAAFPISVRTRMWKARAGPAFGSDLAAAADATNRTFLLISIAAVASFIGLVATVRGMRVVAELAAMKADFVSSVTHELKTPLALIRLVADTLARGRYDSRNTVSDYAALLSKESENLTRLIDNLLVYARLSDGQRAYTFEAVDVADLVDDALERFDALVVKQQFRIDVEVPPDLPGVRADRTAVTIALDNVIDNAIKYSNGSRVLQIRAWRSDRWITISVLDFGIGIRDDEIERVCNKFFRGRDVKVGGSGLGLSIAQQVILAHGGRLGINSRPGQGTRVDLILPVATP